MTLVGGAEITPSPLLPARASSPHQRLNTRRRLFGSLQLGLHGVHLFPRALQFAFDFLAPPRSSFESRRQLPAMRK